jgi:hypothetical protein
VAHTVDLANHHRAARLDDERLGAARHGRAAHSAQPGDAYFYAEMAASEEFGELLGERESARVQVQSRTAHRVLDVSGPGIALVEIVVEDLQILTTGLRSGAGVPDRFSGRPTLLRVCPDGTVVEHAYGAFGGFVGIPVRIGTSGCYSELPSTIIPFLCQTAPWQLETRGGGRLKLTNPA